MPANDRYHSNVINSLIKAGWSIVKEQHSIAIGRNPDDLRRLYVDIAAQSQSSQIVLIEVKSLEKSPVHQFMNLVGQYVVYRTALDLIGDDTPLYVGITESDYELMVEHPIGQQVIYHTLREPIPFLIYDPILEEILQWIPSL